MNKKLLSVVFSNTIMYLTLLLFCGKLFGLITWSWIWVFSPVWIVVVIGLFLIVTGFCVIGLVTYLEALNKADSKDITH